MNWFRQNRSVGAFLVLFGACVLGAVCILFRAKNDWDDAAIRFNETAVELNRLERLAPYPSSENLRRTKKHLEDYASALATLKEELKTRVFPITPMAPNEFQSRLRLTMAAVADKARANKVRLPERFSLGFDEFTSSLPNELAAPLLGQELAQIEWLLNTLCEARVEALSTFRRTPLGEEHGPTLPVSISTSRKSGTIAQAGATIIERNVVEATFVSTPAAARKVLNQIAGASQHFFIVRLVHVRNEKDKGPPREGAMDSGVAVATTPSLATAGSPEGKPAAVAALNFIVGNERIETTAKIEIVRFLF
jgi:hypothetical protein